MAPPVVALGLFGTGLIGTAYMKQLAKQVRSPNALQRKPCSASLPATAAAVATAAAQATPQHFAALDSATSPHSHTISNYCFLQTPYLLEQLRVDVRVVAVSNSRKMLLSNSALQGTEWRAALDSPQVS
jgi:homoserine dehydrogenase